MPKENDKMIKKKPKIIFKGGFGVPKPPKNGKNGIFEDPQTPPKIFLSLFFISLSFSLAIQLSRDTLLFVL